MAVPSHRDDDALDGHRRDGGVQRLLFEDATVASGEGVKPRRGESWAGVTIQVPNWSSYCTPRTASHGLPRRTVMRKGRSTAPGQGAHQSDHRC